MKYRNVIWSAAIVIALTLLAPPAHANAMIPFIVAGWFGMFLALVPIILIESAILVGVGAGVGEALLAMLVANLASTLVGIPLSIACEIGVGAYRMGDISEFVQIELPLENSCRLYGIAHSFTTAFVVDRSSDRDMDCGRFVSASGGLRCSERQPGDLFDPGSAGRWLTDLGCVGCGQKVARHGCRHGYPGSR